MLHRHAHLAFITALSVAVGSVAQPRTVKVFLLSGQSNMGGGAPRSSAAAPGLDEVWYDYAVPGETDNWTSDWVSMSDLIGEGVEQQIAQGLKAACPDEQIAVVKVYQGATPISYWQPGGGGHDCVVERMNTVEARLVAQQADGDIAGWEWAGFVWFQGENDAAEGASMGASEAYLDNLNTLTSWVRTRTGDAELPVVVIRIWSYAHRERYGPLHTPWTNLERVRFAHTSFCDNDPFAEWVDTDDLPIKATEPHYYEEAYHEAGRRAVQAYRNIVDTRSTPQSPYVDTVIAADNSLCIRWGYVRFQGVDPDLRVCSNHGYTYTVSYGTSPTNLDQQITGIADNQCYLTGLVNGNTYYFTVHAVDGAVEGTPSSINAGTPTTAQPSAVLDAGWGSVVSVGAGNLQLDASSLSCAAPQAIQWTMSRGPASVTFSDPTVLDPQVSFRLPGVYVLSLNATVNGSAMSDTVWVSVRPKVSQSSQLGGRWGYIAIDGVIDTVDGNAICHTQNDNEAWWEMDLGAIVERIDTVRIHNRGGTTASRLQDFSVFVSDEPFTTKTVAGTRAQDGVFEYYLPDEAGPVLGVAVERSGRFVRIQLNGTNYLHMTEVVTVFGSDMVRTAGDRALRCAPALRLGTSVRGVMVSSDATAHVRVSQMDLSGRVIRQHSCELNGDTDILDGRRSAGWSVYCVQAPGTRMVVPRLRPRAAE